MSEILVPRNSAKAVLMCENSFLILHPSGIDENRNWHIPGGIQYDPNEALKDTAVREVWEETGIDISTIEGVPFKVSSWKAVDKGEKVLITAQFFLFLLNKKPIIVLSDEHDDSAWINKKNKENYPTNIEVDEIIEEKL